MKKRTESANVTATHPGPNPAEFPIGSMESRAAARVLAKTRLAQGAKTLKMYRAPRYYVKGWKPSDDFAWEYADYETGLPIDQEQNPSTPTEAIVEAVPVDNDPAGIFVSFDSLDEIQSNGGPTKHTTRQHVA